MNLLDLVDRTDIPTPWDEGDNIPWDDPVFSQRMLKEHLTQEHDAASRRFEAIDRQVEWIHQKLLLGHPTGILDLACGPGLYSSRLANLGHRCVGIDYSPASIAYAGEWGDKENLDCTYLHQDIRAAEYGTRFGLAMLIYGEFNVFRITDARTILKKTYQALNKHGILLLESHTLAAVKKIGEQGILWYSSHSGLFSNKPHLCLEEHFWDETSGTTTIRYFIVDASSGDVTRYAQTFQAYSNAKYQSVLTECGFGNVEFFPSLAGTEDYSQDGLTVIKPKVRIVQNVGFCFYPSNCSHLRSLSDEIFIPSAINPRHQIWHTILASKSNCMPLFDPKSANFGIKSAFIS